MAARTRLGVGSAPWIDAEKENVVHLLEQEKEELIYPAQHEMEWLNEHMAEIFSRSHFNVTNVFKTPGKLRGKTPRTARKRNAPESRRPLSDVFSAEPHVAESPRPTPKAERTAVLFSIAQDEARDEQSAKDVPNVLTLPKKYTDSGYQGSTEDELEAENLAPITASESLQPENVIQKENPTTVVQEPTDPTSAERRTTEGSFHSAKENMTTKVNFAVPDRKEGAPSNGEEAQLQNGAEKEIREQDQGTTTGSPCEEAIEKPELLQELDDIGSPSDGSTPDRPLVRKSSLTFASLPAREPLTTKASFGARDSRTSHLDVMRNGRSSYFGKQSNVAHPITSGSHTNGQLDHEMTDVENSKDTEPADSDLEAAQAHKKSSTQRLHDKIDMLGKSQARLSKSHPTVAALAAANLRKSEAAVRAEKEAASVQATIAMGGVDEDDSWIKPLQTRKDDSRPPLIKSFTPDIMENLADDESDEDGEVEFDMRAPELIAHEERMRTPVRTSPSPGKMLPGFGHTKSASTATLVSPGKAAMEPGPGHVKAISVSNPRPPTTTPKGSPRRIFEAPLSASRSKLHSIMKTAKGLFTSSAGVSAAAKMDTLSPKALRIAANNMPALYPNITGMLDDKPLPPSPPKEGRRTRSSTEREKEEKKKEREMKDRQKVESQLDKAREKEKQNAAQFKAEERLVQMHVSQPLQPLRQSPRRPVDEHQEAEKPATNHDMPPPPVPPLHGKVQRPIKPSRELSNKNRPQPMSIRVGSSLQRMPITTSSLASSLQETLPPIPAKQNVVNKKASNVSTNSATSNTGFKSSLTSQPGKPRALLAAERKREADERETQRKLEQKRETERKRAAQQEEARRQEQRQRAEAERMEQERAVAEQAKKNAQQQAMERRRQEQMRKLEQQRNANAAHEPPSIPQPANSSTQRHELGTSRPASRLGATSTLRNLPTNPAKPPKRPHEDEVNLGRAQPSKYGGLSQQTEAKRRRTEDEDTLEPLSRPTISGAPVRQSNMGKKPNILSHGYAPAPTAPHTNPAQNLLPQFPQPPHPHRIGQPHEMSKYANGNKIPFAEAPNPPARPQQQQQQQQHHKTQTPHQYQQQQQQQQHYKSTLQLVKSSPQQQAGGPQYTPGETIALPEIPTDSEDSADDSADEGGGASGFPVPSWASPNTLTNQLIAQEAIDGDAVFGPIAPLRMEEIFAKGSKDRLKKFRDRTSSANWALSGDGLTVEEVRADREMRERMRREGGWRYGS